MFPYYFDLHPISSMDIVGEVRVDQKSNNYGTHWPYLASNLEGDFCGRQLRRTGKWHLSLLVPTADLGHVITQDSIIDIFDVTQHNCAKPAFVSSYLRAPSYGRYLRMTWYLAKQRMQLTVVLSTLIKPHYSFQIRYTFEVAQKASKIVRFVTVLWKEIESK